MTLDASAPQAIEHRMFACIGQLLELRAMTKITSEQQEEIAAQRKMEWSAFDPCHPIWKKFSFSRFPCSDHGFVRVVDYMGNDEAVVSSRHVSYGKGTRKSSEDAALIAYLLRHVITQTPYLKWRT